MRLNEDNVTFDLRDRRAGRYHADRDVPEDARDRTIAQLKKQVTILRRELSRRDDVLMFLAGMVTPRSANAPETTEVASGGPPADAQRTPQAPIGARNAVPRSSRAEAEKPQWPALPEGYRVVATASDAWVLVARGERVAGYRGILDPDGVARDAWDHHGRGLR